MRSRAPSWDRTAEIAQQRRIGHVLADATNSAISGGTMETPNLNQRISECGKQLAAAALREYTNGTLLHPVTLIAACARVAGSQLLRNTGLITADMPPGSVLLSPEANAGTALLLRTCAAVLTSLGDRVPAHPPSSLAEDVQHVRESFLDSHRRLVPIIERLRSQYNLDESQMARSGAVAAALVIHSVRAKVPPDRAFGVASFAFTEGAKTVPPAFGCGNAA